MTRKRRKESSTKLLFRDPSGQEHLFEKSLEEELEAKANAAVKCLGMTFENDEARREYFLEKLRTSLEELHQKLDGVPFTTIDDAISRMQSIKNWPMGDEDRLCKMAGFMKNAKQSEDLFQRWKDEVGFPHGDIKDILNLSDPPYYTACPNPFIGDFISHYGKSYDPELPYDKEPFAADVREGKNDTVYKLHSYHTKVPYKSITHFIRHFTEPGDLVLDVFCGSGMTAVAASLTDRVVICCDLSTSCTFITHNYVIDDYRRNISGIETLIESLEKKYHDAINTAGHDGKKHRIQFVVWSDIVVCPNCSGEVLFWGNGVDVNTGKMNKVFPCSHCNCGINTLTCEKAHEAYFDPNLDSVAKRIKRVPVLITYKDGNRGVEKKPDEEDLKIIRKYENVRAPNPKIPMSFIKGDMYRAGYHYGMTHVHHFFDQRVLCIAEEIKEVLKTEYGSYGLFVFTSLLNRLTRMNRFIPKKNGSGVVGPFSGTLYMPPLQVEREPLLYLRDKIKTHRKCAELLRSRASLVSTQSATDLNQIPYNSIDYVFIDPPFGSNLMYSEINFLFEYWLDVFMNPKKEAIQNSNQKKELRDYRGLMAQAFMELYRVLKPGRWMTIEFHNSNNSVWQAIQSAMWEAGFVIADVRVLDKKKITMLQGTHANIAKQDLVISAYKPNGGLEDRFKLTAGTEEGVWDFLRLHLKQLPVFVTKNGQIEVIAERQSFLLFDRMVAFHVQRGVTVPMSTSEFYAGLAQRFPERDGMYFLKEQAAEYDKKRMTVKRVLQFELFVKDESSAIEWLKQQVTKKPKTFQEIHPQFMKEIGGWEKHEKPLELSELLSENFLCYDGKGEVPSQIHSYLSSNFKELRNLKKEDPAVQEKAKNRWYVPDPNKAGDLEKLRERTLLREFEEYRQSKQKRLKVFRLEAVRAGFKKAWQERNYQIIIDVARRIPENVLQEDPKLLMWYDQAVTRVGGA